MKSLHLLTFCFLMLFQQAAHSRECFSYLLGGNPQLFSMLQSRLRHLNNQELSALETLAFMYLGHDNLDEFIRRGFLDFQFYETPNIAPPMKPKGDHYKLMMHYNHYSQTIIYNATTNQIVEGSTRENF